MQLTYIKEFIINKLHNKLHLSTYRSLGAPLQILGIVSYIVINETGF